MKNLLQYLFLLLHLCLIINTNILIHSLQYCAKDDQSSLLHLKKNLSSYSSNSKLMTWNSSTDCCSWPGVSCSINGRVVGLDISSQSISGGIDDSSSLFNLQHLRSLNLADNNFGHDSHIPSAIGKLTQLRYLNLSNNFESGKIPIEISRLKRLVVLDISQSFSTLTAPNLSMLFQNLTKLSELYLDGVDLSAQGTHWCQTISSSLPNLRVLSLSECSLSGPIDQSLAKLQSLSVIRLDKNYQLSGPLPESFANFSKLTSLSLAGCELQGTFPKEIFQVPTLQTIDLSSNEQLQGSLPEFPKNGSLQSLHLGGTNFGGSLPDSIGNLKMLSEIDLSGCSFTGHIPQSMGNLTQLVGIDMSSNGFSGPIDSIHWENLNNLEFLNLGDNLLNGSIPSSIFTLPMLEYLPLFQNLFSGQLREFSNVSSNLYYLDLSSNKLEGEIPVSIFNFRGLEELDLSSNNFSAFPFNGPQQPRNLWLLDLSSNRLLIHYNDTNSSNSSFLQIRSLSLASNKLRTFPDFLKNQTDLGHLDLSDNQLHGKIPNWVWRLNSLYSLNLSSNSLVALGVPSLNFTGERSFDSMLDLHSNQLRGRIPIFSPFPEYLDYSSNCFNSSIPTNIGEFLSRTRFFSISNNNLHGHIPMSLCTASNLEVLDLSNNSLNGTVPQCLTATGDLQVLNLGRNNLTGIISHFEFPDNCGLETLDLNRNQIEGQFPKSLANCSGLKFLNLGKNLMTDTFPCLLKNISTLRVLGLPYNKFYGRIGCPWTNSTWPVLQIIDLAHNNFHGEIPGIPLTSWRGMINANGDDTLFKIGILTTPYQRDLDYIPYEEGLKVTSKGSEMDLKKILSFWTLIDFSCNKFNGSIPKEMGEFKALNVLNLSNNAFTGKIPSTFGKMRLLESLDLSQNKLSGQIPSQLANLTFLAFLNLSNNQLVGRIPTGTQFSTFPNTSFTGNKGLWGPPLTVDNKPGFSPPTLKLNGSLPNSGHRREINWDVISVEIGFAVGFGVAVGSLVVCKRWSKWYYKAMYKMLVKIFPQLEERIGPHRRHIHINQRRGR